MTNNDLKQFCLILAAFKVFDDQLLLIENNGLKQSLKRQFSVLKNHSSKLYKELTKYEQINANTIDEMTDTIHEAINEVRNSTVLK